MGDGYVFTDLCLFTVRGGGLCLRPEYITGHMTRGVHVLSEGLVGVWSEGSEDPTLPEDGYCRVRYASYKMHSCFLEVLT